MSRVPGKHESRPCLRPERFPLLTAVFSCATAALSTVGALLVLAHQFWPWL